MKKVTLILLALLVIATTNLFAQNAPISTAGNVETNGSTVILPITVTNFSSIGSCNLKLHYNPAIGTVTSVTANPLLTPVIPVYYTLNSNYSVPGEVAIGWSISQALTVPDNTPIFYIHFSKVAVGISTVTWDSDNNACVYTNSSYNPLNDIPLNTYYIPGSINFQTNAPISSIAAVSTCSGTVSVPIKVTAFNNIGAFGLSLSYDPMVLTFISGTNTSGYEGLSVTSPVAGVILIGGYSSSLTGVSFTDNTVLCTLNFSYLGGTTSLNWFDDAFYGTCEWAGPSGTPTLNDSPQSTYYKNGSVHGCPGMQLKVFLEGPYAGGGLMNTVLNDNALLPLTSPYGGGESVSSIPAADIVDWVSVELRDAVSPSDASSATKLAGWPKAFFLKSDGSIVGLNGLSPTNIGTISVTNNLYVIIRHRNHISIMSANGMALIGNSYGYDFSIAVTQAYGGASGYKELRLSPGICGMVDGNADGDAEIGANDFTVWSQNIGLGAYLPFDIDMDADVGANDFTEWSRVIGLGNNIPAKTHSGLMYKSQVPQ